MSGFWARVAPLLFLLPLLLLLTVAASGGRQDSQASTQRSRTPSPEKEEYFYDDPEDGKSPTTKSPEDPLSKLLPYVTFECSDKAEGYYADVNFDCEVFHYCKSNGLRFTFLCPHKSRFNQKRKVCDYDKFSSKQCKESERYFASNNGTEHGNLTFASTTTIKPVTLESSTAKGHALPKPIFSRTSLTASSTSAAPTLQGYVYTREVTNKPILRQTATASSIPTTSSSSPHLPATLLTTEHFHMAPTELSEGYRQAFSWSPETNPQFLRGNNEAAFVSGPLPEHEKSVFMMPYRSPTVQPTAGGWRSPSSTAPTRVYSRPFASVTPNPAGRKPVTFLDSQQVSDLLRLGAGRGVSNISSAGVALRKPVIVTQASSNVGQQAVAPHATQHGTFHAKHPANRIVNTIQLQPAPSLQTQNHHTGSNAQKNPEMPSVSYYFTLGSDQPPPNGFPISPTTAPLVLTGPPPRKPIFSEYMPLQGITHHTPVYLSPTPNPVYVSSQVTPKPPDTATTGSALSLHFGDRRPGEAIRVETGFPSPHGAPKRRKRPCRRKKPKPAQIVAESSAAPSATFLHPSMTLEHEKPDQHPDIGPFPMYGPQMAGSHPHRHFLGPYPVPPPFLPRMPAPFGILPMRAPFDPMLMSESHVTPFLSLQHLAHLILDRRSDRHKTRHKRQINPYITNSNQPLSYGVFVPPGSPGSDDRFSSYYHPFSSEGVGPGSTAAAQSPQHQVQPYPFSSDAYLPPPDSQQGFRQPPGQQFSPYPYVPAVNQQGYGGPLVSQTPPYTLQNIRGDVGHRLASIQASLAPFQPNSLFTVSHRQPQFQFADGAPGIDDGLGDGSAARRPPLRTRVPQTPGSTALPERYQPIRPADHGGNSNEDPSSTPPAYLEPSGPRRPSPVGSYFHRSPYFQTNHNYYPPGQGDDSFPLNNPYPFALNTPQSFPLQPRPLPGYGDNFGLTPSPPYAHSYPGSQRPTPSPPSSSAEGSEEDDEEDDEGDDDGHDDEGPQQQSPPRRPHTPPELDIRAPFRPQPTPTRRPRPPPAPEPIHLPPRQPSLLPPAHLQPPAELGTRKPVVFVTRGPPPGYFTVPTPNPSPIELGTEAPPPITSYTHPPTPPPSIPITHSPIPPELPEVLPTLTAPRPPFIAPTQVHRPRRPPSPPPVLPPSIVVGSPQSDVVQLPPGTDDSSEYGGRVPIAQRPRIRQRPRRPPVNRVRIPAADGDPIQNHRLPPQHPAYRPEAVTRQPVREPPPHEDMNDGEPFGEPRRPPPRLPPRRPVRPPSQRRRPQTTTLPPPPPIYITTTDATPVETQRPGDFGTRIRSQERRPRPPRPRPSQSQVVSVLKVQAPHSDTFVKEDTPSTAPSSVRTVEVFPTFVPATSTAPSRTTLPAELLTITTVAPSTEVAVTTVVSPSSSGAARVYNARAGGSVQPRPMRDRFKKRPRLFSFGLPRNGNTGNEDSAESAISNLVEKSFSAAEGVTFNPLQVSETLSPIGLDTTTTLTINLHTPSPRSKDHDASSDGDSATTLPTIKDK